MTRAVAFRRRLTFDRRILLLTLAGGAAPLAAAIGLLWTRDVPARTIVTAALGLGAWWLFLGFTVRRTVVTPLQALSNMLACLREGDASLRASGARRGDVLGEVMLEANGLAATLREQRLDAREATALLQRVMAEIDAAVFAFDAQGRIKLVNRAGERLLDRPAAQVIDETAAEAGLAECLSDSSEAPVPVTLRGRPGRWEVRRSPFRLGGLPHTLLILTDVSRSLRDEERQAWKRLMRVLGHEINNSLAPIKSIAASLAALVGRASDDREARDDMLRGLEVVASRADALARFTAAYSKLAHLPAPVLGKVALGPAIRRAAGLETRQPVTVRDGPEMVVQADPDLLEQVLINLLKNAVDATNETGGGVAVGWSRVPDGVEIVVEDEGPGLAQTANLFVPFFTTKPGGSGIGLVVSRQIAEAHGGTLVLENRQDRVGCVARLRLARRG
jgi:two-component system, NtrC family, nitrogen regulation sensor histidine kinase NtrY